MILIKKIRFNCFTVLYVFVRLISQLADGYVQSSVGMFTFMMSHIGLVVYFLLSVWAVFMKQTCVLVQHEKCAFGRLFSKLTYILLISV